MSTGDLGPAGGALALAPIGRALATAGHALALAPVDRALGRICGDNHHV